MMQESMFEDTITLDSLKSLAKDFCNSSPRTTARDGTSIGTTIEALFFQHLRWNGFEVGKANGSADIPELNCDIKSTRFPRKSKSVSVHGYKKGRPPDYSMLIFEYEEHLGDIHLLGCYFISSERIKWKPKSNYQFSIKEEDLEEYRL